MTIKKAKPVLIAVELIDIGDNPIRRPDVTHANHLAASMEANGQISPIVVMQVGVRFVVKVGGNRLWAARSLGWEKIEAIVVTCSDDEGRLIEIDDNFTHRDLTRLALGSCLVEREALYKKLHPEVTHGGDRTPGQVCTVQTWGKSFAYDAAEKMGVSSDTVHRLLRIRKALTHEAVALLEGSTLEDDQAELICIGKVDPEKQAALVRAANELGKYPSEILAASSPERISAPKGKAEEEAIALHALSRKASTEGKRRFFEMLVGKKKERAVLLDALVSFGVIREDQIIDQDVA